MMPRWRTWLIGMLSLAVIIALASLQSFAEAKELSVVGTGDGIELLRDVVPMLDKTVDAPLFDDFDKQQIRSLRDTMLDFAQSADSGKNFLSNDLACK